MSFALNILEYFGTFDPRNGLPDELFECLRKLLPLVGVELIIHDDAKGFLLSYRDDEFYKGWHFIGGLLRYRETWKERIELTAIHEIGQDVIHAASPFHIVENTSEEVDARTHSINLLFHCTLINLDQVKTINTSAASPNPGQLAWFHEVPSNILEMHRYYMDYWYIDRKLH